MRSLDRKQNIKRTVVQIFINVFLAIVCLTMVLPLLYMLLCSTKSNEELLMEPFGLPHGGWHPIPPSAEHGCLTMYLTDWAVLFGNRKSLPSASSQTARS